MESLATYHLHPRETFLGHTLGRTARDRPTNASADGATVRFDCGEDRQTWRCRSAEWTFEIPLARVERIEVVRVPSDRPQSGSAHLLLKIAPASTLEKPARFEILQSPRGPLSLDHLAKLLAERFALPLSFNDVY